MKICEKIRSNAWHKLKFSRFYYFILKIQDWWEGRGPMHVTNWIFQDFIIYLKYNYIDICKKIDMDYS